MAQLQTAWSLTNGKKTRLGEELFTQLQSIKDSARLSFWRSHERPRLTPSTTASWARLVPLRDADRHLGYQSCWNARRDNFVRDLADPEKPRARQEVLRGPRRRSGASKGPRYIEYQLGMDIEGREVSFGTRTRSTTAVTASRWCGSGRNRTQTCRGAPPAISDPPSPIPKFLVTLRSERKCDERPRGHPGAAHQADGLRSRRGSTAFTRAAGGGSTSRGRPEDRRRGRRRDLLPRPPRSRRRVRTDAEKRNAAVMAGWRVLHFTPRQVRSGAAVQAIETLLREIR